MVLLCHSFRSDLPFSDSSVARHLRELSTGLSLVNYSCFLLNLELQLNLISVSLHQLSKQTRVGP